MRFGTLSTTPSRVICRTAHAPAGDGANPGCWVSVPVFVLSSILFFSPPASLGTGVGLAVYFTVFLMLTETGNTISTVNYHSLLPELYRDEKRRNHANALRQAMQLLGMIIGVSLVPQSHWWPSVTAPRRWRWGCSAARPSLFQWVPGAQ